MKKAKKRRIDTDVEILQYETKESKFNNKRCLLTAGGAILKPDEVKDLKRFGVTPSGIMFDSEMEAEYYRDVLLPRELDGEIQVTLQPRFVLLRQFEKKGKKYRAITYSPDFMVEYMDGKPAEAIDVKGMQTEIFNIKRKLFDAAFPDINLLVMKRVRKFGGWITAEEYTARKKQERSQHRSVVSRTRGRARKWN